MNLKPTKDELLTAWALVGFMSNISHQDKLNSRGCLTEAFLTAATWAAQVTQGQHLTLKHYQAIGVCVIQALNVLQGR